MASKGLTTKKLHRLVKQSKFIWTYDKQQGFDYVRSCLTPPLDDVVKFKVDKYLKRISVIYASLGTDSEAEEIIIAKATEKKLISRIKEIAPDYYETIKGNNDF